MTTWQGKQEALCRSIVANTWEGTPSAVQLYHSLRVDQLREVVATADLMISELQELRAQMGADLRAKECEF